MQTLFLVVFGATFLAKRHTHTNSYSLCDFLLAKLRLLYVVIGDWAKCLAKWKMSLQNIEEICVRTD